MWKKITYFISYVIRINKKKEVMKIRLSSNDFKDKMIISGGVN